MSTSSPKPSRTGCWFSLAAFEAAVHRDQEILGLLYTGSLGNGMADPYSDLDMEVWVTRQAFMRAEVTLRRILSALGTIQFMYSRGPGFVTAFVDPDWQRVDLHLHGPTETKTFPDYAHGHVVKDVTKALARMVAQAPDEPVTTAWDDARAEIEEAIDSIIYLTLHNARGAGWSAAAEVTSRLGTLYALLAQTRGRASHGFRYVTELLSQEEQAMLARAWPSSVERDEVRRAASHLWDWTQYVWSESERVLGRPLEIEIDEHGMLEAIDRIYAIPQGQ